ncbi:MAG TPA: hypothetical protein VL332_05510 [Candidatus Saccharimonadaceae bacterium]|jgi:hypothetical protein|nr:hypothetical protein [Candidatus Saccharimonadaceae bacterium]
MLSKLGVVGLTLALYAGAAHAAVARIGVDNPPPLDHSAVAPLPYITSAWGGGPNSLSYNVMFDPATIVNQARALAGVDIVIQEFLSRGYIRRADHDTAFTGTGRSVAILSFQRPGVDMGVEQPFIIVESRAIFRQDENGWLPATMIIGGLAKDSSGVPVREDLPGEPPVAVVAIAGQSFTDPQLGVMDLGHAYLAAYSMQEWANVSAVSSHQGRKTNEEKLWWDGYLEEGTMSAIAGGGIGGVIGLCTTGPGGFPAGVGWGAFSGFTEGVLHYMFTHPYPSTP